MSVAPTIDTAAATVVVPETAAAETEAVAVPETVEAEKEGSLAAVSEVVEKERERRLVSETVVVDKEVDAGAFMIFCGAVFLCLFVTLLIHFKTTLYNYCIYGL